MFQRQKERAAAQATHDVKMSEDRAKRFEYMMKRADIFAHFMTDRKAPAGAGTEEVAVKRRGRPKQDDEGTGSAPAAASSQT